MGKSLSFAVLLLSSAAAAQCLAAPGNLITVGQDSITGPNAIGFAFSIYGTTYTDIHVSGHGICFFSNGGVPAPPPATPLLYSPSSASLVANGPVVCPFWSDTVPGAVGGIFIDAQATMCTITWFDVQSYGYAQPLMSFQMKLYDTGQIEFRYSPEVTNNSTYASPADNAVIGVSPGSPSILPASSDFSAGVTTANETVFEHFLSANTFDIDCDSVLLTPTSPGWIVVEDRNGAECAYVRTYGAGCANLVLTGTDPIMGQPWELTTTGLQPIAIVGFTFFAFGRANPSVPLSALGLNAPGCESHLPPAWILTRLIAANNNGTMVVTLNIPLVAPWLIGRSFTNQTASFVTTNPAGIASSNAVHCTMGF